MNDISTANVQLSVGEIISNGISSGLKNFLNLLLTGILFALTFWIPYLNIGTFIGLQDLVPKMSRKEPINPTEIFDAKYRKNFGEFFLLMALFYAGVITGVIFLFVGALVVQIAWMLALPLFVDKGTGPIESLRTSHQLTHGHKMIIFLAQLVFGIGIGIIFLIFYLINETLGSIVLFLLYLVLFPILLGIQAYIYGKLTAVLDSPSSSAQAVDSVPPM